MNIQRMIFSDTPENEKCMSMIEIQKLYLRNRIFVFLLTCKCHLDAI